MKNPSDDDDNSSSTNTINQTPLLDDIQGLLDKERRLYELKMQEKEEEIAQLKQNFQSLQASVKEQRHYLTSQKDGIVLPPQNTGDNNKNNHWQLVLDMSVLSPGTATTLSSSYVSRITHLNISSQQLTNADFATIVSFTRNLQSCLTSIDLSGNCFDDTIASSDSLTKLFSHKNLNSINLSRNLLGISSAAVIATAITTSSKLKTLYIQGNPFSYVPNAGEVLGAALAKKNSLVHFETSLVDVIPSTFSPAVVLSTTTNTKKISSPSVQNIHTFLSVQIPKGGATMTSTKKKKTTITEKISTTTISLGLSYSQLSKKSMMLLLKVYKNLTSLDLSYSFVGIAGVQVIAASLKLKKPKSSLISLNLTSNKVGGIGCRYVGLALESNDTLTSLNLSNNELRGSDLLSLAHSLEYNDTLVALDVSRNDIQAEGCVALQRIARHNSQLVSAVHTSSSFKHDQLLQQLLRRNIMNESSNNNALNSFISESSHREIAVEGSSSEFTLVTSFPIVQPCTMEFCWEARAVSCTTSSALSFEYKIETSCGNVMASGVVVVVTAASHKKLLSAVIHCDFENIDLIMYMRGVSSSSEEDDENRTRYSVKICSINQKRLEDYQLYKSLEDVKSIYIYSGGSLRFTWMCSNNNCTKAIWKLSRSRMGFGEVNEVLHEGTAEELHAVVSLDAIKFSVVSSGWKAGDVAQVVVSSNDDEKIVIREFQVLQEVASLTEVIPPCINFASVNPFQAEECATWAA